MLHYYKGKHYYNIQKLFEDMTPEDLSEVNGIELPVDRTKPIMKRVEFQWANLEHIMESNEEYTLDSFIEELQKIKETYGEYYIELKMGFEYNHTEYDGRDYWEQGGMFLVGYRYETTEEMNARIMEDKFNIFNNRIIEKNKEENEKKQLEQRRKTYLSLKKEFEP